MILPRYDILRYNKVSSYKDRLFNKTKLILIPNQRYHLLSGFDIKTALIKHNRIIPVTQNAALRFVNSCM